MVDGEVEVEVEEAVDGEADVVDGEVEVEVEWGEVKVEIGCEMAILGAKLDTGRVGVKVVCRRNSAGG